MADKITMDIDKEFGDYVLEEGDNTSINLRKVSWNGRSSKLDIRKWFYDPDNNERAMKGVTLSEEGGDELTNVLVDKGYGDTNRIYNSIKTRDDFNSATEDNSEEDGEEYYDPSELLGGM